MTEFLVSVLRLYYEADAHETLWWRVDNNQLRLFAPCNDTFAWATSDLEQITPESLETLKQAAADLAPLDGGVYLSELFAARVRRQRPQQPWFKDVPTEVAALFEACATEKSTA